MLGEPTPLVKAKIADRLNDLTRKFVERSPFVCVATGRPERHVDRSELPRSGEILRAVGDPQLDVEGYERARDERYARREGFY